MDTGDPSITFDGVRDHCKEEAARNPENTNINPNAQKSEDYDY
jgi:hypothetical protein